MKDLFTILTLTKDNSKDLEVTLSSINSQNNKNFIWLIYDGSLSHDESNIIDIVFRAKGLGLMVEYMHQIDKSLYDAMNNSVKYVKTEYVLYLNSGDMLFQKNTVNIVLDEIISSISNIDVFYGNNIYINPEKNIEFQQCHETSEILDCIRKGENLYFQLMVCQQAIIYKTNILKEHPIDTQFPIAADHNHFLDLLLANAQFKKLDHTISIYFGGGFSWQHAYNCVLDWFRVNLKASTPEKITDKLIETYIEILESEIKN